MWSISFLPDPLASHRPRDSTVVASSIVHATISLPSLFANPSHYSAFQDGGRKARVALADSFARRLLERQEDATSSASSEDATITTSCVVSLEPLDKALHNPRRQRKSQRNLTVYPPYILDRTDIWCTETEVHIMARANLYDSSSSSSSASTKADDGDKRISTDLEAILQPVIQSILSKLFDPNDSPFFQRILETVAVVALQNELRGQLKSQLNAVAFIADGSILPRKSGASEAPMASPPAIPFLAPPDSPMSQDISVYMGKLNNYLPASTIYKKKGNSVLFRGLVVPTGVTLICGGGYHGKSTMLQTIASGVYDKIPGDGRECCVAVSDALSVRAEDGRYVNNCNISAFISNLPTPPGVERPVDTTHFSTRDSSGSTSQAANVSEAIEMGASALLVDEDISAANFMARDGRMRSLVMDESITPLLYRVNGLYKAHGISSVVVVGGVGDWLDVPDQVILLDKYVASDATAKARSISKQFSHGHVQYAGRGVVHRLEWEKKGTPIPRRPTDEFAKRFDRDVVISVLDGGHAISLHKEEDEDDMMIEDDEDDGCIDAGRLEQLLGRKQLYGCGLCVAWLLQQSPKDSSLGMPDLLQKLDQFLDNEGMVRLYNELCGSPELSPQGLAWCHLIDSVGFATRPRAFEVAQALTRMRGVQLEELPFEEDLEEIERLREAERKKKELAVLWEQRRKRQIEANPDYE